MVDRWWHFFFIQYKWLRNQNSLIANDAINLWWESQAMLRIRVYFRKKNQHLTLRSKKIWLFFQHKRLATLFSVVQTNAITKIFFKRFFYLSKSRDSLSLRSKQGIYFNHLYDIDKNCEVFLVIFFSLSNGNSNHVLSNWDKYYSN